MATVAKRLLTICLALTFLVGVTAQLTPVGIAQPQISASTETTANCSGPQPPCAGHLPNCIDHVGCVTPSALPTSAITPAVQFEWTELAYDLAPASLAGISVKPELSPPILTA